MNTCVSLCSYMCDYKLYMRTHVFLRARMCVSAHCVYVCEGRPEVDVGCFLSHSPQFFLFKNLFYFIFAYVYACISTWEPDHMSAAS